jgi:hypothetical protein
MSPSLQRYLELETELETWRKAHPNDTPEDDAILDALDAAWWALGQEDQDWINARDGVHPARS